VTLPAGLKRHPFRIEPVSVDSRTGLCQLGEFLPGNGLARSETGPGFSVPTLCSALQRLASLASPPRKPRKVNDYSHGHRKPDLRRTAWWSWQDSNPQANGYEQRMTRYMERVMSMGEPEQLMLM
jgi:hypothetical protein